MLSHIIRYGKEQKDVMAIMGMGQFLQAMTMLPQIINNVKKMNDEEKENFVNQLCLEGEEREVAMKIITCFQEGRQLDSDDQIIAQKLLDKALDINGLDMSALMNLNLDKN